MDVLPERLVPALDASSVAGRITAIIARRHEQALAIGDARTAARYDVSLETIYFASLLLTVADGSGETRGEEDLLSILDTTEDVISELRSWVKGLAP